LCPREEKKGTFGSEKLGFGPTRDAIIKRTPFLFVENRGENGRGRWGRGDRGEQTEQLNSQLEKKKRQGERISLVCAFWSRVMRLVGRSHLQNRLVITALKGCEKGMALLVLKRKREIAKG